jgi:leucyl-tRNA synthetase
MVKKDGETMSKSKGNVVAPEEMIAKYGADTLRAYILFMAPPDKDLDWSYEGVEGMFRFLARAWRLVSEIVEGGSGSPATTAGVAPVDAASKALHRETHRVIGKVTRDIESFGFNTALSAMMELVNATNDYRRAVPAGDRDAAVQIAVAESLTLTLAPYVPHMAEELWRVVLGRGGSVHSAAWPAFDAEAAAAEEIELPVQINGKVRARITVPADAAEEDVVEAAMAAAASWIEGRDVKKVVVVPGKLVSVVVAG